MRKLALCLLSFTLLFSGCAGGKRSKTSIVCTIFPQYSWVQTLVEGSDSFELTLLQDSGTDLHSYQPTATDKVKILTCDLLIYVGGPSDEWVDEMLKDPSKNPDMRVVKLLDYVDALDEKHEEGEEHEDEEHGEEKDEHVWLSLKNAEVLFETIYQTLQKIEPDFSFEENYSNFQSKLHTLEADYSSTIKGSKRDVLLFGDRFPFRYLARDYSLKYFAAFSGCSAEIEASFETVKRLAETVDLYSLPYILVLEGSDKRIAEQIKNNTKTKDQQILTINSLQSVKRSELEAGADYLQLMQANLEILKTALN